ncbi:MAG TPA: c-type cytochrome domain-containing protein, partial [Flavitalea sp.]|nr:c-type cytochrome domain-containing protein [Flavitalea sp.]
KGRLRLDSEKALKKGGKDGVVLYPGDAQRSDLIKRLLLPRKDDDHMPPKEKPQLTEEEIKLVHWWVTSGASFQSRVFEVDRSPELKKILSVYESAPTEIAYGTSLPDKTVEAASENDLQKLRETGAIVTPVAQNSNYLLVNLINAKKLHAENSQLLSNISKQMLWLRAAAPFINDTLLTAIGKCVNLRRLQLDHAAITDEGLKKLSPLHELQHLNLVGTRITIAGIKQLRGLTTLRTVYCYQTGITKADLTELKQLFPNVLFELGGYDVPTLSTDTTELK